MVKLVLDPQVLLSELDTWRHATLMTRRRGVPHQGKYRAK
jgi:hypothetical protein